MRLILGPANSCAIELCNSKAGSERIILGKGTKPKTPLDEWIPLYAFAEEKYGELIRDFVDLKNHRTTLEDFLTKWEWYDPTEDYIK